MSNLNTLVKQTLKAYGEDAAAHFGLKPGTLAGYIKRGKYPLKLVEQILSEQKMDGQTAEQVLTDLQQASVGQTPPLQPANVLSPPDDDPRRSFPAAVATDISAVEQRVEEIAKYIQTTVDFYIRQFNSRIGICEKGIIALSNAQLRATGMPSLARPAENVPVEQTFTTNPNPAPIYPNALNTGIAPTKEMVDAQANMTTLEGVPIPGARVAGPAEYIPNQPAYGFGWNQARPPRR